MSYISKDKILLILILTLAAVLRLAFLPKLMVFTPDEEYQLYLANTIIKNFHIIWIGVSTLGFDFYMGPFWIYIIYPFVALFKGDPIVLGYISSILGVFTTFLLYFLGKKMFNNKVGIIASLIYATSALIIYYDQQPYPAGVPFLSLLITLSLFMSKYSNKWWLIFAASYGMVFHIHLSLFLTIIVALYWGYIHRGSLNKKVFLLSVMTFFLVISPLIAFDYFHRGSNITAPIRILQNSKIHTQNFNLSNRLNDLLQPFGRMWLLDPHKNNADEILNPCMVNQISTTTKANWFVSITALLLFIFFLINKDTWRNENTRLLILLSLAFLLPFIFLPVIRPIEYYLLGFFPLFFLIIASLIKFIPMNLRNVIYIVLVFFAVHGVYTVMVAKGDYGLATKKKLIVEIMQKINNQSFNLQEEGDCHKYGGWRYLFSIYGRIPVKSSEDQTFGWLYPEELSTMPAHYSVIIKESRAPININHGYNFKLNEGGFSAYIFQN